MKAIAIAALAAGAGLGAYLLFRRTAPVSADPTSTPQQRNFLENLEDKISGQYGVPLREVGNAAVNAPTWAKVAFFPVGVTAVTQKIISNPKGAVNGVVSAGKSAYNNTIGRLL